MVAIMIEPAYGRSIWGQNLTESLITQLKLKRIPYQRIATLGEIDTGCRYLFVIGTDSAWVESLLNAANQQDVYPILISNEDYQRFNCLYSTVCSDVMSSMRYLVNWLHSHNRRRIGLYGVNPESLSDLSRLHGYQTAIGFAPAYIYYNHSSLSQCYECLAHQSELPDALICTNSFAAVSLARHLQDEHPDYLKKLLIISCQESLLAGCYAENILNVHLNSSEYGKGAVLLYENLRKADYLSHMVMSISWDMRDLARKGAGNTLPSSASINADAISDPAASFYRDSELRDMMLLENLLHELSPEDRTILSGLMSGHPYTAIADSAYMTVSTVKYRIKRMVTASGLQDKNQLLGLIHKYIPHFPNENV